jgi:hypothetical protein
VIIIKNTTTLDNGFCVTKFPINSIIWALKMMMFVLVCLFAVSFHFFEVFSFQIFTPKTEKNYWRGFFGRTDEECETNQTQFKDR